MTVNIKVNYLYNSGFTVETEKHLLIFDYYMDSVEQGEKCRENGAIGEKDLTTDKKVLVFVSHRHPDHFNPVIFKWWEINQDIEYVLSNDIKKKIECSGVVHKMQTYKTLELTGASIKTFGSTDVGVSFLVSVDGISIFHAGDLNWWYWNDNTEEENKQMTGMFKAEISKIQGHPINVAFFPVDKRLEDAYCMGAEYFIEKISPNVLIPMHFGETYNATTEFAEKMREKKSTTKVAVIGYRGQLLDVQCNQ